MISGGFQATQAAWLRRLALLCFQITFCPIAWSTFCALRLHFSKTELSHSPPYASILLFKSYTIHFAFGVSLYSGAFFNLFSYGRTKKIFFPQLFLFILLFFSICAQTVLGTAYSSNDPNVTKLRNFLIVIIWLESGFFFLVFCVCYILQWIRELQDRIDFWKFHIASKASNSCHQEPTPTVATQHLRRQRKFHSNAVEDLLLLVIRAAGRVQDARSATCKLSLEKSSELLKELQKALTNPDNLYAVQVFHKNHSVEIEKQGSNVPLEGKQLEAEFLEIFANRKTCLRSEISLYDLEDGDDDVNIPYNKQHYGILTSESQCVHKRENPVSNDTSALCLSPLVPSLKTTSNFSQCFGKLWNWNVFNEEHSTPHLFTQIGLKLLESQHVFLKTTPTRIQNYVHRIEHLYYPNPFHNALHAVMVTHWMWYFLSVLRVNTSPAFTLLDAIAVAIGCLGHDIGHPGRNNQFFLNSFQEMTLLYNDQSALENYHCALVFKCLEFDECDIFEFLDPETMKELRKKIISLILVTDMAEHFEFLSRFRLRRQAEDFNFRMDPADMWLLIRLCMKCADLSHVLLDWNQHHDWELRLAEEYYQQGEAEAILGLPTSPLCDRNQHNEFPKTRKNFIECVVFPLLIHLEELDETQQISKTCVQSLICNKNQWEKLHRNNQTVEIPQHIRQIRTHPSVCKTLLSHLLVPKGFQLKPSPSPLITAPFFSFMSKNTDSDSPLHPL